MRNPRTTILLLTAIAAAFGLNSRLQPSAMAHLNRELGSAEHSDFSEIAALPAVDGAPEIASTALVATQSSFPVVPKTPKAAALSADANALVTEMCDLHLLAEKTDLSMTSQEWSAFAGVVVRMQAIRQTYEAQIATAQKVSDGCYRLEIPAYPAMGDALREKFHDELRNELGETKAGDVLAKLGDRLESRFAGFGVGLQTLDITTGLSGSPANTEVTRTVTYWNSVEGTERLTTQREVHYPGYEDPTGDSWSALLSVVKA